MRSLLPKFSFTILLSLLLTSVTTHAQVLSAMGKGNAYFGKGVGVLSVERLRAAGVTEVKTMASNREITLLLMGGNGQILKQFVIERTAPAALSQFRPSKLRQWSKTLQATSGGILQSKIRRFPYEAMAFFSAIGAINMYDLIFHYQNNPVIMSQFAESQKDPLTHLSFMAFMAVNGLASEPLQEVVQNRKMHYFLPYFGMSMGMMASNIVHDLGSAKSLHACAGALLLNQSVKDELCDKAFDEMQGGWNTKWGHYATGWLSMMGSTMLGGAADWIASTAGRRAMQFVGLDIAFSMGTGGGMGIGRFAWTVIKNTQFLALDFWLHQPIENVWMNVFGKASELDHTGICLGTLHQLYRVDLSGQSHPRKAALEYQKIRLCPEDLVPTIQRLSALNREFRVENMKQVLTAHQNWETYLSEFASHYRSSRLFYQHVTDQIWKRNYGPGVGTSSAPKSPLDQTSRFFGVLPKGTSEIDWTVYLQDITSYEEQQLQSLNDFGGMLQSWLTTSEVYPTLTFSEQRRLQAWISKMSSRDANQIRLALNEMSALLPEHKVTPVIAALGTVSETPVSYEYRTLMQDFASVLGQPQIINAPGESFLKAWSHWQSRDEKAIKEGLIRAFPQQHRDISTPTIPESLIASMNYGPDVEKGESVIQKNRWGGVAAFRPPRIISHGELRDFDISNFNAEQNAYESVFTNLVLHDKFKCEGQGRNCFRSNWDYLRGGWVRPEVMTKDGNKMASWWSEKVETPYVDAWFEFEVEYEKIVKNFANQLFATDHPMYLPFTQVPLFNLRTAGNDMTNGSGFSNAGLPNLAEEREIYLLFLSDYLKAKQGQLNPVDDVTYRIQTKAQAEKNQLHRDLLAYVREWDEALLILPQIKNDIAGQIDPEKGLLMSRAPNIEIEAAVKKLDESLASLSEKFLAPTPAVDGQELLEALLGALKATHQELLDYGLILNTASYVENHGSTGQELVRRRCVNMPVPSSTTHFRGETAGCP